MPTLEYLKKKLSDLKESHKQQVTKQIRQQIIDLQNQIEEIEKGK